jgi:RimJ/RimL family protein N-acetyltransferase
MMKNNDSFQPVLETERLTLRPLRKSDAGLCSLYSSDWRVASMTTSIPHPNPPGAVEAFIASTHRLDHHEAVWAIDATKGFGTEFVGIMGLRGSGGLGYWIAPFFWNLGIASEAGAAVVDYAFKSGAERVHASHFEDNPASGRVMVKLGMAPNGVILKEMSVARGEVMKMIEYERSNV